MEIGALVIALLLHKFNITNIYIYTYIHTCIYNTIIRIYFIYLYLNLTL